MKRIAILLFKSGKRCDHWNYNYMYIYEIIVKNIFRIYVRGDFIVSYTSFKQFSNFSIISTLYIIFESFLKVNLDAEYTCYSGPNWEIRLEIDRLVIMAAFSL